LSCRDDVDLAEPRDVTALSELVELVEDALKEFDDFGIPVVAPDLIDSSPVEILLICLVLFRIVRRSADQTNCLEPPHILSGRVCTSAGPIGDLGDGCWFVELQDYRKEVVSRVVAFEEVIGILKRVEVGWFLVVFGFGLVRGFSHNWLLRIRFDELLAFSF